MTLERLDNLVRTGQVHQEPPDQAKLRVSFKRK